MVDAKYSSLSSQRYTSFITEVYPPCGLRDDNSPLLSCFLSPIDAKVRDLSTPSRYIVLADQSPPRRVLIEQERASLTRFEIFRSRPGHVPSRLVSPRRIVYSQDHLDTKHARTTLLTACRRVVPAVLARCQRSRLTLFSLRYRHVALLARCLRAFFPFDRSETRSSSEPTCEFYRKTRGAA